MNVDKIPVVGKINKTINAIVENLVLLAIICLILGFIIPFFPQVLDFLMSAMLVVAGLIFLNMAIRIYTHKKKYTEWLER